MPDNKTQRGIYAPNYYGEFKCVADKCRHNCCIDWEICIDEATYAKYKQIPEIKSTVKECEDGPCFALTDNGRCPHLNDSGLCRIILSHGEDYLSEICQNHPRFYNYINSERTEAGLGIVCEEACRLIIEDENRFELTKVEDIDDETFDDDDIDFDSLSQRDRIISKIEALNLSFDEKLKDLKSEYEIPELYRPDEWLKRFLGLEILDADWEQTLISMKGRLFKEDNDNSGKYVKYYERLLKYFVYRHVSVSANEYNLRARLAFAILSVEVIKSLFENDTSSEKSPEKLIDFARRYSAEIEYSEDNTAELVWAFESSF